MAAETNRASLEALPNLGPYIVRRLAEIGICDSGALREAGAVPAYARLKFRFGREITLNALWALEGALSGTDWREISDHRKGELKAALQTREGPATETDRQSSD